MNHGRSTYEKPSHRRIRVFAYDPTIAGAGSMTIELPYRELQPGPVDDLVEVVDYDASNRCYYPPVDLDASEVLIANGLKPSESDPRFHQQMVYAVVAETIERFRFALGREPEWNAGLGGRRKRLLLLPHALQDANAFYSRSLGALAFGYFPASESDPGVNLPGQTVFTCLSHDIIAHETTHALIDGQKSYFLERTSVDTGAFHEAFADIVALLLHLAHKDMVTGVIRRSGGLLYRSTLSPVVSPEDGRVRIAAEKASANPFLDLARQFGEALGTRRALRSALGTAPDTKSLDTLTEPHDRGAVLVAAVFDAFFSVYVTRTAPLLRLGKAAGAIRDDDVHPDLAERLAAEAMKAATHLGNICIRALDYCPPVDIQFGDFLRSLITADMQIAPDDPYGYRSALIEAFRSRGIRPANVASYAEDSLRWSPPRWDRGRDTRACDGLVFRPIGSYTAEELAINRARIADFAQDNATVLRLKPGVAMDVHSIRSINRVGPDGRLHHEIVAEVMQQYDSVPLDPGQHLSPTLTFRGGTTLIFDAEGSVLHAIGKPLGENDGDNPRLQQQRLYYRGLDARLAAATYLDAPSMAGRPRSTLDARDGSSLRFDLVHRGY